MYAHAPLVSAFSLYYCIMSHKAPSAKILLLVSILLLDAWELYAYDRHSVRGSLDLVLGILLTPGVRDALDGLCVVMTIQLVVFVIVLDQIQRKKIWVAFMAVKILMAAPYLTLAYYP